MGPFDQLVGMLSDEELEERRAGNLGELDLSEAITVLKVAREYLEMGNRLRPEEHTENIRVQMLGAGSNLGQKIKNLLSTMSNYGPNNSGNLSQERASIIGEAKSIRDTVVQILGPSLRADTQQLNDSLAEADRLKEDFQALKAELAERVAELANQQQALAADSGAKASAGLAEHYKGQADHHREAAKRFLRGAIVAGILLAIMVVGAFGVAAPEQSPNDWTEFASGATFRVLLLSVAGFALVFCVRNYRVNMHLEVLNKRRENALETFNLFQGAATTEDARNLIVGELVRAVFAHEDTGYVNTDSERTIIESPGGVVTALASLRGRDG